jgi:hypothetical protein
MNQDQERPEGGRAGQQRSVLAPLDAKLAELRAVSPAWRIWYVPTFNGSQMHVTWCANPLPILNCGSPEELTDEMRAADAGRSGSRRPSPDWLEPTP